MTATGANLPSRIARGASPVATAAAEARIDLDAPLLTLVLLLALLAVAAGAMAPQSPTPTQSRVFERRTRSVSTGRIRVSTSSTKKSMSAPGARFTWRRGEPGQDTPLTHSLVSHGTTCAMYAPMIWQEEILGIVYVDNYLVGDAFDEEDLDLFSCFAAQAAVAILSADVISNANHSARGQ